MPPAMTRLTPRSFSHGGKSPGWCSGAATSVLAVICFVSGVDINEGKLFTVPEMLGKASVRHGNSNSHISVFLSIRNHWSTIFFMSHPFTIPHARRFPFAAHCGIIGRFKLGVSHTYNIYSLSSPVKLRLWKSGRIVRLHKARPFAPE